MHIELGLDTFGDTSIGTDGTLKAHEQVLRDVVDQALTGLRQTTQGAEEQWVHDPRDAWWHQGSPALLHTSSFMTRAHDLHGFQAHQLHLAHAVADADEDVEHRIDQKAAEQEKAKQTGAA